MQHIKQSNISVWLLCFFNEFCNVLYIPSDFVLFIYILLLHANVLGCLSQKYSVDFSLKSVFSSPSLLFKYLGKLEFDFSSLSFCLVFSE